MTKLRTTKVALRQTIKPIEKHRCFILLSSRDPSKPPLAPSELKNLDKSKTNSNTHSKKPKKSYTHITIKQSNQPKQPKQPKKNREPEQRKQTYKKM